MKTRKIPVTTLPTHADIAQRAHELWERAGRPENCDLEHWLEAERQLGGSGPLHDDARRLTAEPNDPAASDAAEVDQEIERIGEPSRRRSATSL